MSIYRYSQALTNQQPGGFWSVRRSAQTRILLGAIDNMWRGLWCRCDSSLLRMFSGMMAPDAHFHVGKVGCSLSKMVREGQALPKPGPKLRSVRRLAPA